MAYENIIFDVLEGIATITFNRPKALNALNGHLLDELSAALDEIEADEEIRVLILTGAGEKSFVAGADITELATFNTLQGKMFSRKGQLIIGRLQEMAIPVIAAVNGFALGGGTELALACDLRIASTNAVMGLTETSLAVIPGGGGTQRLPRIVGLPKAKELIYTARRIDLCALRLRSASRTCCGTLNDRVSLISMAAGVILNTLSSKPINVW